MSKTQCDSSFHNNPDGPDSVAFCAECGERLTDDPEQTHPDCQSIHQFMKSECEFGFCTHCGIEL